MNIPNEKYTLDLAHTFIYSISFLKLHEFFCYLCQIYTIPDSEAHSFAIQSFSHKNMCSMYSIILWGFIELLGKLNMFNIMERL